MGFHLLTLLERRNKQMKVGKLSITSLLTSLPPSKTDASSFHVDVNVVQVRTGSIL